MSRKQFDTLQALMRQTTIRRWHICEVRREQSLAEHSYRVWALSVDLYRTMFGVPHNSIEFHELQTYALVHDCCEILTGDINSYFKSELEKIAPGAIKRAEEQIMRDIDLGPLGMANTVKGSVVVPIVEIADLVEAMLYFKKYGVDDPLVCVQEFQDTKLKALLSKARELFPQHAWDGADLWVEMTMA